MSYIKFTFTEDLNFSDIPIPGTPFTQTVPDNVLFDVENPTLQDGPHGKRYFQITRWGLNERSGGEIVIGSPTPITNIAGESSAANFEYFYNTRSQLLRNGIFSISRVGNVVTFTGATGTIFYENTLFNNYYPIPTHPSVIVEIDNAPPVPDFRISSITYSQADSQPCQKVKATITTTDLAVTMFSPNYIGTNGDNPIVIDVLRGAIIDFYVRNAGGDEYTQTEPTPALLNKSNFNLLIQNNPVGATVIVQTSTVGLILEYSLNGVSFQSSETFTGLPVGSHTMYVRDNLGCSFDLDFQIDSLVGVQQAYFLLPKSNSIRYANRITWGDSENYKTDENTLSCEVDVDLPYQELQQFQSADKVTTQFRSNYASNVASVIKEDGSIVNVPVLKMTDNLNIKDRRDARVYNLQNGKSGVYFVSGNTYDYLTLVQNGTYALNGLTPEWAQQGNYFDIAGAWYIIEEIVFDDVKNADVLVITRTHTGSETNVVVGSIFNRFNYEVYEYMVDMVNYIDQKIQTRLVVSDPKYTTITHLSEVLWIKVKHESVVEIRYKNKTNTDIFYSTGIEHIIRIGLIKSGGKNEAESEDYKTDTTTILLNGNVYEGTEFHFEPVTKEIMTKLMIALHHESVKINGVYYVINGNVNVDGPQGESNLYLVTATMVKSGSVYNSQTSGATGFNTGSFNIPALISTNVGYVRY